jgi:hypothetical protein
MSRRLSGSRRSPRPTESTRSQNITLSCRCSAGPGEDEGRCRPVAEDAGVFWFSDAPQSEQKFEFAWLGCPHVAHTRDRWAPQLAQNLLPSDISALQNGQSIDAPTAKPEALYDRSMLCTTAVGQVRSSETRHDRSFGELGHLAKLAPCDEVRLATLFSPVAVRAALSAQDSKQELAPSRTSGE